MNVLSLFDGISCGQLTLRNLGIKVDKYFASEIDQDAIDVTMHNFPNTIQLGDVCKVKASDLPQIDLLLAGSPCQGFSSAGMKKGLSDERSKLYFEFERLLKELQPKYFLLENVVIFPRDENVISTRLGYDPIYINSGHFAIAERPRFYWTNIPVRPLPLERNNQVIKDVFNVDDERIEYYLTLEDIKKLEADPDIFCETSVSTNHRFFQWRLNRDNPTYSQTCRAYYQNQKYPCILTSQSYKILHPDNNTIVYPTLRELEIMQGLPAGYVESVHDSYYKGMHGIGNGWSIPTIEHILQDIEHLMKKPKYNKRKEEQLQLFHSELLQRQIL